MKTTYSIFLVVATLLLACSCSSSRKSVSNNQTEPQYSAYLFVYFEGAEGTRKNQEQIRFATSPDAVRWKALNHNQPILNSDDITLSGGIRDPHILRSEDGNTFYMVVTDMSTATNGWKDNPGITMLKSTDLINWEHRIINLEKQYPAKFKNVQYVWAPQTIYDPKADKYLVYFTIKYRDDETLGFYGAYANKDFTALENEPVLMFTPKDGGIDADIIYKDDMYHLFFKGNSKDRNGKKAQSGIKQATAKTLQGPWKEHFEYLDAYHNSQTNVEGSSVFKLNDSDTYILMYDLYSSKRYEFQRSTDLHHFTNKPESFTKDFHPRHGCIMSITAEEAKRLNDKWGENTSMNGVIEKGLNIAESQALFLAREALKKEGELPRTYENDELKTSSYKSWISGFFPGVLWYLYENKPTAQMKKYAETYTTRVEEAKHITNNHDVGFMLNCSFGNGYRITGNPAYLDVMKIGARSLSTRYNPAVGVIQSWGTSEKWQYPVIIDNMMNLEFLTSVAQKTGESRYREIADSHAKTTMANHFRPDYSSYHVVSYDTLTAKPHAKNTHQGYADESAWARGQAWGVYGYTMMYRETGNPEYLEHARHIASFIINHPNLPEDKVPYWDFNSPEIPNAPRDASAAAIMASALVELSQLDKSTDSPKWLKLAEEQIRSLTSPAYLAETGTNGGFILTHSVGNHNKNSEVNVPLSYADYYYVEALMRLKKMYNEK